MQHPQDSPKIAMQIAGSRVGMSSKSGNISSIIRNLSKNSMILPRHTRQFTRTYKLKYIPEVVT